MWGNTAWGALNKNKPDELQILTHFIKEPQVKQQPDLFIQITIPSEFQPIGKYSIGITAGTETSLASIEFVTGCDQMDLNIVPSQFTKQVLGSTRWTKKNTQTGQIEGELFCKKPIEVLFEGLNTEIYTKTTEINPVIKSLLDPIPEDFLFLTVGHWLKGDLGQDRKDIGNVIKVFYEVFKNRSKQPGLLLKLGTNCEVDKDFTLKRIKEIKKLFNKKDNLPQVYLLNGNLLDDEMNSLYNHPKIKSMVSFTHGEGFGRPLLEFSVTGKPILVSDWSGQKDFLPNGNAILLKGKLEKIHPSAVWDTILIKESSWFRVDYEYAGVKMDYVYNNLGKCIEMGRKQTNNAKNFTLEKMTEKFENIIKNYYINKQIAETDLFIPQLPKLTKLNKTMDQLINENDEIKSNIDITKIEGFEDVKI
jgi:glycosyltransferase involved in cell wall biosynthesis